MPSPSGQRGWTITAVPAGEQSQRSGDSAVRHVPGYALARPMATNLLDREPCNLRRSSFWTLQGLSAVMREHLGAPSRWNVGESPHLRTMADTANEGFCEV